MEGGAGLLVAQITASNPYRAQVPIAVRPRQRDSGSSSAPMSSSAIGRYRRVANVTRQPPSSS